MGFFINSSINAFILKRQHLLDCQARVEAAQYKCLRQTSYVDCVELYPFEVDELSDVRDPINDGTKLEIQQAVAKSKTIERRYKRMILGS